MPDRINLPLVLCLVFFSFILLPIAVRGQDSPSGVTYYVSSSLGSDSNSGVSESAPFASVSKVNSLALQPGDTVRFMCGDVWRADPLVITRSGSAGQPITYTSYPAGCVNQPVLTGN